ncbi:MAG: molybdopterin molybdotransferase MoeA [Leucobacter sp.]
MTAARRRRTVDEHLSAVNDILAVVGSALRTRPADDVLLTTPGSFTPMAQGRILATAQHSRLPLPPFDNSQMDGFAVRAADIARATEAAPTRLPLGVTTAAGDAPITHAPGTASPVMTGAPIPLGADAVVPVEHVDPPEFRDLVRHGEGKPAGSVSFLSATPAGTYVRKQGSDLAAGSLLAAAEARLSPALIGALAAAGIRSVPVRPRVRVLLCSTGDELAVSDMPQTSELTAGHIHDANTPMLAAALSASGAEVQTVRTRDNAESLRDAITARAADTDLVLTSGGISAGAYEVVRDAFAPLGAEFVSVAMQPGGPQGTGLLKVAGGHGPLPALCFPGNPVSALLSAELFLLPYLRSLVGKPSLRSREERLLAHSADSPKDKLQLRRGQLAADGRVVLSGPSSHLLAGLATADVIVEIPAGVAHTPENFPVITWKIND